MIILGLVLGFLISGIIFLICFYSYSKKVKNILIGIIKINSQNYLESFVNTANKKDFRLKNIIDLLKIKINKIHRKNNLINEENYILKNLIDVFDEGILIIDNKNTISYLNDETLKLFNLQSKREFLNKNINDTSLYWILKFYKPENFEVPSKYTNINILCSVLNITDEYKIYKFKNISEYKKLDQMSKEFVSNITHELKTPLTSIIGFSETLKSVEEEEDRQMFYDIINREAIRLNNLISDILIFSEIETQNDINKQKIDITKLLFSIKQLLIPQIDKTKFKIILPENSVVILGCEKYLRQIFINIIDNSIKHSFGTTLKIICYEDNENVFIEFSDDGIGIPENEIEDIFGRFYKVLNSKTKSRGTGLGLSIVESSIKKLNGSIEVFNNEICGATFVIKVPKI